MAATYRPAYPAMHIPYESAREDDGGVSVMGQKNDMTVEADSNYPEDPETRVDSGWNGVVQQDLPPPSYHSRNKRKLGPTGLKAQIVDHQVGEENLS